MQSTPRDPLLARFRRPLWISLWGLLAAVLSFTLWRGFIDHPQRYLDAKPLYLGGRALVEGVSPYDTAAYSSLWREVFGVERPEDFLFAYPPTFSLWLLPLGALPLEVGLGAFDLLNLICLGISLGALSVIAETHLTSTRRDVRLPLGLLLAALAGPISAALLLGQSGLWVVAPVVALWALSPKSSDWIRAVFLLLLTFKPTITLPFLLYFAMARPRAMMMAVGLSLPAVGLTAAMGGGLVVLPQWLGAMRDYSQAGANLPSEFASGQSLLYRLAPSIPGVLLTLIGGGIGGYLGMKQRSENADRPLRFEHLLSLCATVIACCPIHSYDLVIALPLALALPFLHRSRLVWYAPLTLALVRPELLSIFGFVGVPMTERITSMLIGICGLLLLGGLLTQSQPPLTPSGTAEGATA